MQRDQEQRGAERVVLVGYLGSGKSEVGRALALRLEWDFLDFDEEIERREGRSVRALVDERGEEYLRSAEAALTEEATERAGAVLAPGGAWITQPELLAGLGPRTVSVWLRVSPSEAYRRLRASDIDHPLRGRPDAVDRMGEMMREREELYRLADVSVPTDGRSVETIAFEIEQLLRARGAGLTRVDGPNR